MKPASPFEASRVAFVTSEMAPWSKAGGLGDVAAALPDALARLGHELRVFVPLYDTPATAQLTLQPVEAAQQVPLQVGEGSTWPSTRAPRPHSTSDCRPEALKS